MHVATPNILAVIIMALVYMGLAKLWYSCSVFGKIRMESCGIEKKEGESCKASPACYVVSFIQAFIMAFVLGYFINAFAPQVASEGMKLGLTAWVGFIATTELCPVIWGKQSIKTYLIDAGFMLVIFAIWGTVFAVWH
ncbi:MAG TPA: DUF1761 domain-containing protein [Chlamydiales bacterium]|nr:DUF1761 domain-containing protein [Chlamydiales bacterium]